MLKTVGSLALLTPALLGAEGFGLADKGFAATIPDLDPAIKEPVCRNDWNASIKAIGPLIGSSDITPEYREELVWFHHQLQDWRAVRAKVDDIPGCEGIAMTVDAPTIEYSRSAPLDFEGALESVVAMRSLPSGYIYIQHERPQTVESIDRSCRVVDSSGRRIDLSTLCMQ
ncbi:hypothetical protein IQ268_10170 [Oculatella sp. LEGE 06141]|uniref:hypothetical protein n=1 Tax=Oculatella sp. LEGE 06141 TaxID=1828648 RepID=UPI00187E449E|nr:hypothetical protein [Oculatella sp. LEGE 06141]MBE9178926.1 hypothetical protein [Oculatella sp. LEGE 06141]